MHGEIVRFYRRVKGESLIKECARVDKADSACSARKAGEVLVVGGRVSYGGVVAVAVEAVVQALGGGVCVLGGCWFCRGKPGRNLQIMY